MTASSSRSKSVNAKSAVLGMPLGTARNKLLNRIVLHLLTQLGEHTCHRCGMTLDDADDISIDHKTDWFKDSDGRRLFFDMSNVAFSHKRCNTLNRSTRSAAGFRGVRWFKEGNKKPYNATIYTGGRSRSLGYYATAEEAAMAYDAAAVEKYGKQAVTNKSLGLLD